MLVLGAILLSDKVSHAFWFKIFKEAGSETTEKIVKKESKYLGKESAEETAERIAKKRAKEASKKGYGYTVGGSSTELAKKLGIYSKAGWAAHHIIPVSASRHRILQKIGFDFDCIENGIALPTKPGMHPKLPVHAGDHPSYRMSVIKDLDKIPDNLTVSETRDEVFKVISKFRKSLEDGRPLHNKYGASNVWD